MPRPRLFSEFDEVSRETLKVLHRLGFERATAVQEAVIPLFSGHKDVAVDACTGSGKTLAFVIPVTEKLRRLPEKLKKYEVGCILIAPTRELSKQIFGVAKPFLSAVPGIQARLLVGGSDPVRDISEIKEKGANVLIGTPGRIDDILKRSKDLSVQKLEVLVLDEADRLLDMGFRTQLDSIMAQLPRQRRTGLFSATQTEAVEELVRAGLRNPFRVNVAVTATAPSKGAHPSPPANGDGVDARSLLDQKTPLSLRIGCQVFERVEQKLQALVAFLVEHANEKVIVYFLTCACVNYYAALLPKLDELKSVQLLAVHGKLKQAARERNLSSFSASPTGVLLCTDLAARGLDIPDVQWILQFDPPQDPSAFVHRVGRTARMGRSGDAMAFLLLHESSYVDFLRIRKVPLSEMEAGAEDAKAVHSLVSRLRRYSETDRDLMERGVRAFVSYVRGYKEHHCRFIFRLQDLELGHLANAFGLLRLPKMKEIRRVKAWDGFTPSEKDPGTVKYSDKAREKQRQKLMAEQHAAGKKPPETKQVPPVLSGGKKASAAMEITTKSGKKLPASKRRLKQDRQDLQDLMEEYSLLKKLKKGKINEEEFDRATQWEEVPESSRPADDAGRSPRSSFSVPAGGNGDEDGGVGTGVKARSRATGDPGMKRNAGLASARKKEKHRKKRKKASQPGG